jgi:hypothetical protein
VVATAAVTSARTKEFAVTSGVVAAGVVVEMVGAPEVPDVEFDKDAVSATLAATSPKLSDRAARQSDCQSVCGCDADLES